MFYVRAKQGDWPLHLQAVKLMMPYFFVSRHANYARYGLYYLEDLPNEILEHFMKGSHVIGMYQDYGMVCGVTCLLKKLLCGMDMGNLA